MNEEKKENEQEFTNINENIINIDLSNVQEQPIYNAYEINKSIENNMVEENKDNIKENAMSEKYEPTTKANVKVVILIVLMFIAIIFALPYIEDYLENKNKKNDEPVINNQIDTNENKKINDNKENKDKIKNDELNKNIDNNQTNENIENNNTNVDININQQPETNIVE